MISVHLTKSAQIGYHTDTQVTFVAYQILILFEYCELLNWKKTLIVPESPLVDRTVKVAPPPLLTICCLQIEMTRHYMKINYSIRF